MVWKAIRSLQMSLVRVLKFLSWRNLPLITPGSATSLHFWSCLSNPFSDNSRCELVKTRVGLQLSAMFWSLTRAARRLSRRENSGEFSRTSRQLLISALHWRILGRRILPARLRGIRKLIAMKTKPSHTLHRWDSRRAEHGTHRLTYPQLAQCPDPWPW